MPLRFDGPLITGLMVLQLVLLPGAAGAEKPAAGGDLNETTQVTLVEVPVQVVRNGEPVRGLKAADFEITEGRQPRPITGFDAVDLAAPENQLLSADVPAAGKRHFLLLFDLANSNPKSIARARIAILQSLFKTLTPSDLAAVAVYDPRAGIRLVQGFTSDLRQIAKAVSDLGIGLIDKHAASGGAAGGAAAVANAVDRLNQAAQELATTPPTTYTGENAGQIASGKVRASIAEAFIAAMQTEVLMEEGEVAQEQHDEIAQAQNSVAPLTRAFEELARMMAAVSGRKLVVLFSEGFDSTVLSGDDSAEHQALLNQAIEAGGSGAVDNDERYGNTHQTNLLEKMLEQFRRSDCVIESIDISGLRGMDLDASVVRGGENSLATMARDTGGEVFRNTNDLSRAMEELGKRTSVTYVLSFQPESLKPDGAFHAIKVRLKNAPRGTSVTYRPGYYAPVPYGQRKPLERQLAMTDQLLGANEAGSIATAVMAEPFRIADSRLAYVPVVLEMDGKTLLDGMTGKVLPTEIFVYAVDASGAVIDSFNQTLQVDITKAGPQLSQGGLKFFGHLELPAGAYALRVLVRNGATGAYSKRTAFLAVPAFGVAQAPVLLPPVFPEAASRWALVHETPRGTLKDAAYPFVVGQRAYVPASRPVMQAGQQGLLAVLGYNLGSDRATAAKVQTADGKDVGECTLSLGSMVAGSGGQADVVQASFRVPEQLAPGTYRLVLTSSAGSQVQTTYANFAVAASAAH